MPRPACRAYRRNVRRALLLVSLLIGCTTPATDATSAASSPLTSPVPRMASPATTRADLIGLVSRVELPARFTPYLSKVSPDARFVAAVAADYGGMALFRLGPADPSGNASLIAVAEISGLVMQATWLEDSSAVLVQTDLIPGHTVATKPRDPAYRVVIVNTDGRMVTAPASATSFPNHHAFLSPDKQWLPLGNDCCLTSVRVLSRDGAEVRTIATAADTEIVGFVGWDRDGLVLYQRVTSRRSMLHAATVTGFERYELAVPSDVDQGVYWGISMSSPDRSWQVVTLATGMGMSYREDFVLLDQALRRLPADMRTAPLFPLGSEVLYLRPDGAIRAFDPRTGAARPLPLVVPPAPDDEAPIVIGLLDRHFVWMERIRGFVGKVDAPAHVELPLRSPPTVERLDGAKLAEYRPDSIAIIDLAEWYRRFS
jgi:hypothetical protein